MSSVLELSPAQAAVRSTVLRFRQVSSSQLRRLHYSHKTPRGAAVTCSEHLRKLSEQGVIRRLPYKLSNWGRGSGEFIYEPPPEPGRSGRRVASLHTLAVTELYVRLVETMGPITYDPEPWCHKSWGGFKVTPDAYVRIGRRQFFVEIDFGTEMPSVISGKMNRYIKAWEANSVEEGEKQRGFPLVLWVAQDTERVRVLEREAKRKNAPGLFACCLFDEAVEFITA